MDLSTCACGYSVAFEVGWAVRSGPLEEVRGDIVKRTGAQSCGAFVSYLVGSFRRAALCCSSWAGVWCVGCVFGGDLCVATMLQ